MKINKAISGNTLQVTIELPLAQYTDVEKIKITTKEAIEIAQKVSGKKIISILNTSDPIKNFLKNPQDTNVGLWIFEIAPEEAVKKTSKRRKAATPKQTTQQKSSGKKTSIRGRISKIAKDIEENL